MLDFGLVLLGLLSLIFLLGVPYLLISHMRLKAQVRALEARVAAQMAPPGSAKDAPVSPPVAELADPPTAPGDQAAIKSGLPWGERKPMPEAQVPEKPSEASKSEIRQLDVQPPDEAVPPRAFVLRQDRLALLVQWMRDNWVLVAGAASLALAGVFMVQYGVENGLLTPFWRVMAALGFGVALVVGGEVIRRRVGDETEGAAQHLASALAGAGLVTLFAGVLSARILYGLVEPGMGFAALCLVSVLALVLGWFYGAFLTALGILGACLAPFLVGGQSQAPWMLYYYFALISVVGLGVDTIKRWAWISGLALLAPISAACLLYLAGGEAPHFLAGLMVIAAAGVIVPERSLFPRHAGRAVVQIFQFGAGARMYPEFPTRISACVTGAVSGAALLVAVQADQAAEVVFALGILVLLLLATLIWMRQAVALFDHALLPGLAILALSLNEGFNAGPLLQEFHAALQRPAETAPPQTIWVLMAIGALGSALAYLRMQWSLRPEAETEVDRAIYWAVCAAVFAPSLMLVVEFTWAPVAIHGTYTWALAALLLAAGMTFGAERCARGPQVAKPALRVALFAIAALTLIAFALFLVLSKSALTLALAVMVVLVVVIDRKYDLPTLAVFVQLGVAVITYRLVLDPGVFWALDRDYIDQDWRYVTPLWQVLLAYLGSLGLLGLGWRLARGRREKTALVLESAAVTLAAVFLSVLILRLLPEEMRHGHAGMGLLATVWTACLMNQIYRISLSGRVSTVLRGVLALGYGLAALGSILALFVFANPLFSYAEFTAGPLIFDSLAAAYLPLAAVFAGAALRLPGRCGWLRRACAVLASALGAYYVSLEIRRFWQGDDLSLPGVSDPELYSYTVALLLASAGGLILAFWRRSDLLRKLAMAGVVLTIAKVFLVDMSGLSGLMRVFSFMGLGLALVGLAWLNRVMNAQWQKRPKGNADPAD
jgi:uncharacterized membrane protein